MGDWSSHVCMGAKHAQHLLRIGVRMCLCAKHAQHSLRIGVHMCVCVANMLNIRYGLEFACVYVWQTCSTFVTDLSSHMCLRAKHAQHSLRIGVRMCVCVAHMLNIHYGFEFAYVSACQTC